MKNCYLKIILFLFLILTVFFYKPIFKKLSLVPAETIYHIDHIYTGLLGQAKDLPTNGILFDLVFQMYPWKFYSGQSLARRIIPLWNPYSLAGMPFVATDQSSVFELTKLLSYPLRIPPKSFMLFSGFITLFLAGFFMYLFTHNLKLGKTAYLISSLAFMLSGPIIAWLGYPLTSVIIWLPLLLFCVDKIIEKHHKSEKIWLGIFALAVGFQFFAGNPEISWFILFLTACYVLFRLGQYRKQYLMALKKGTVIVMALLLGLTLASVQLIPTLEFLKQSSAVTEGRGEANRPDIFEAAVQGKWSIWHNFNDVKQTLANFALMIYPNFFGNPIYRQYWGASNYNEAAQYIGIIALLFSLLALLYLFKKDIHRKEVIFWVVTALICLTAFADFPVLRLFAFLPIFKIVAIGRLRYIFVFSLAVLAGYGVNYLLSQKNKLIRNIILLNILYLSMVFSIWLGVKNFNLSLPLFMWSAEKQLLLIIFILLNIALIGLFFKDRSWQHRLGQILIILLAAGELIYYGYNYHPALPYDSVFPKTAAIEFLQNNLGNYRVTSYKETLPNFKLSLLPNSSMLWGIQDIRGYEIIKVNRYEKLEKQFSGFDSRFVYKSFDQKFFDILGVKYFIQGKDDNENKLLSANKNLSLAYSDGSVNIYENKNVLPRAFVVFDVWPVYNNQQALELFLNKQFSPYETAFVENLQNTKQDLSFCFAHRQQVEITNYDDNQVEILADISSRGYLILTDTYYPGWRAYLDGNETEIYPTDVAFRGVFVPAGQHKIIFKYQPKSFLYSVCVSIISLIIILFLLFPGCDKLKLVFKNKLWKNFF